MINIGSLSISLGEFLGLIVTVVGIWLVVRQLSEARTANELQGLLSLHEMRIESENDEALIAEITNSKEWNALTGKEAYLKIYDSVPHSIAWRKISLQSELVATLVRRKLLNMQLAIDMYGVNYSNRWHLISKVIDHEREVRGLEEFGEHWEWLAQKFDK